jgi:hypothetical protein
VEHDELVANKAYKQDLEAIVKESLKILIEYDKIAKERTVLEEKEKRTADKASASDKKDIEAACELDAGGEGPGPAREALRAEVEGRQEQGAREGRLTYASTLPR